MKRSEKIAEFFYTGFYSGFFPVASGTAGTGIAMAIYTIIYILAGDSVRWINIVLVLLTAYPAIKLGDVAERVIAKKDPSEVVLDEMIGYWITLFALPFSWFAVVAGFFIFRIFDIFKPFPAGWAQSLPGGTGIMLDDYFAGIYSAIILWSIYLFMGGFPKIPILGI